MPLLSDPTLGLVVEIAADQFTESDLKALLMQANLWQFSDTRTKAANKQELMRICLLSARNYAEAYGDQALLQALLDFIRLIIEKRIYHPRGAAQLRQIHELHEALLADGYGLTCK